MKKNVFIIIIIIIAVALIGGGIFIFYSPSSNNKENTKSETKEENKVEGTTNTGDEENNEDSYYTENPVNVSSGSGKMILLEPRAFSESQQIADHLKKTLRKSRKQDYLGDQTNIEPTLRAEHKYKGLIITKTLFQKRGTTYVFEINVSNQSNDDFNEKNVKLSFYTNLGEKIGSQTIDMPYLKEKEKAILTYKITNANFFDACDFALEEIK